MFDNCVLLLLNYKINDMWQIGLIYFTLNKMCYFQPHLFFKHGFHFQIKPEDLMSHNTTLPITCRMCVTVYVCSRHVCIMRDSNNAKKKYSHKHLMQLCSLIIWPANLQTAQRQPHCWQTVEHPSVMKEANPHIHTLTCKPACYHHSIIHVNHAHLLFFNVCV